MNLPARVSDTICQQRLFSSSDSLLVALSGGPDSTALLHALIGLGYSVEAAHLNHQFRGVEADDDAKYVASLCKSFSVKLTTTSLDVPQIQAERKISAQQAAREVRYKFLEEVRAGHRLDWIVTAHNFDDRVETVLLNIIRGTGIDGLRGIPYRRGAIVRPLLDTPRNEVEAYCAVNHLHPRIDSSNTLSKYARNNVRGELLPYLERRYSESIRQSIHRLSAIASEESDFLNALAASWIAGNTNIEVVKLMSEPTALQRRILREWIRANCATELSDVSHLLIEQFRTKLIEPSSVTLPGGKVVLESDGKLMTIRTLPDGTVVQHEPIPLQVGQPAAFGRYIVTVDKVGEQVDHATLHARVWSDGDRIALAGGTKKVQDLFTDKKFPREHRREYPLIADSLGLIAVGELRTSTRGSGSKISVVRADEIAPEEGY